MVNEIPLLPFINLLGQGYSLVLTGHKFGGMVANALAAKLLLQLRQEVSMAQQAGVNVTALSKTLKKVSSESRLWKAHTTKACLLAIV